MSAKLYVNFKLSKLEFRFRSIKLSIKNETRSYELVAKPNKEEELEIEPGKYEVNVHIPYLFTKAGAARFVIAPNEGDKLLITYRLPSGAVFLEGKVDITRKE
ncbi:hypothetical protein CLPUN_01520 [Clostridium puniceum]|uniref:Uncharacterized protein n=1 Tax=Clostridium puniceum TaxID=29367 RepID=A0A1S8TXP6_9CLOT|nr:hypothetical protein [Clostridium puniceum]OOM82450.1 hypothetical protein CLPUN_01520 [Clostridium puniceum]